LSQLGIAVVGVSFDGATELIHDAVRGHGSFAAAVAGLTALRAEGIRSQMEVVLSRQNAHEAKAFVRLAEAVGASEVNFSAMTARGRGVQRAGDLLDHKLWLALIAELREVQKSSRIPVTPNCAFAGECCANVEPHLTCDGWMTPCYLSDERLFRVLDVEPAAICGLLARDRARYEDICGRRGWTRNAAATTVPA
jgi:MoaA/NifB/PqqE/SkfB family radical SAM enzyme